MQQIKVTKGRTVKVPVSFGFDVSGDTFESQIRTEESRSSTLIATWSASFLTDGTDGEVILTLDNSVTGPITQSKGYMDLKRITGGEPVDVFDKPLEVFFRESVTV